MKSLFKDFSPPYSMRCSGEEFATTMKNFSKGHQEFIDVFYSLRHFYDSMQSLRDISERAHKCSGIYGDDIAHNFVEKMLSEIHAVERKEAELKRFVSTSGKVEQWLADKMQKSYYFLDRDEYAISTLIAFESAVTKATKNLVDHLWEALHHFSGAPHLESINVAKMVDVFNHPSYMKLDAPLERKHFMLVANNIVRQLRVVARLTALTYYENRANHKALLDKIAAEGSMLHSIIHNEKYNGTVFEALTAIAIMFSNNDYSRGPVVQLDPHCEKSFYAYCSHVSYNEIRNASIIVQNDLDISTASRMIELSLLPMLAVYLENWTDDYMFERELSTLIHPDVAIVASIIRSNIIKGKTNENEIAYYKAVEERKQRAAEQQRKYEKSGKVMTRGVSEDPYAPKSKVKTFALATLNVITFPLQLFGMIAGFCLSIAFGIFNAGVAIVSAVALIPILIIHTILSYLFGTRK